MVLRLHLRKTSYPTLVSSAHDVAVSCAVKIPDTVGSDKNGDEEIDTGEEA